MPKPQKKDTDDTASGHRFQPWLSVCERENSAAFAFASVFSVPVLSPDIPHPILRVVSNGIKGVQSRDREGAGRGARLSQTVQPRKHPLPYGRGSVRCGRRPEQPIHELFRLKAIDGHPRKAGVGHSLKMSAEGATLCKRWVPRSALIFPFPLFRGLAAGPIACRPHGPPQG